MLEENICHNILENVFIGIGVSDKEGKLYHVNGKLREFLGIERDIQVNFNDENMKDFLPFYTKAKETMGVIGFDIPSENDDGRWLGGSFRPVIKGGEFEGMILFVEDITESKVTKDKYIRERRVKHVLNELLWISQKSETLDSFLETALELLISLPWFKVESKGAIFLSDDDRDILHMTVQIGLHDVLMVECKTLEFGKCLCGKAALTREIVFTSHVDHEHEIQYVGIADHGHYCVPMISENRVLGVINLYVGGGYKFKQEDKDFMVAVSNVMAGHIKRFKRDGDILQKAKQWENALEKIAELSSDALKKKI